MRERLILASASAARADMLRAAAIDFTVHPAGIDEGSVKSAARAAGKAAIDAARALAAAKACAVSRRFAAAYVIGADQILVAGDEWFDKPYDLDGARAQFLALRGGTHRLASAVCVARDGRSLWQATSEPQLTMRRFSDEFLDSYLAAEGESLLGAVGAYRVEGRGVQLFARISGDHFAVLGMPLLELLGFLRDCGVVPA
ncbi:MAG TPA: Maf family protein [Stellaceae bacterium]|nr:Maf family protein [Stellaceae bacterium]